MVWISPGNVENFIPQMSHIARNLFNNMCSQSWLISSCASEQSDQSLYYLHGFYGSNVSHRRNTDGFHHRWSTFSLIRDPKRHPFFFYDAALIISVTICSKVHVNCMKQIFINFTVKMELKTTKLEKRTQFVSQPGLIQSMQGT